MLQCSAGTKMLITLQPSSQDFQTLESEQPSITESNHSPELSDAVMLWWNSVKAIMITSYNSSLASFAYSDGDFFFPGWWWWEMFFSAAPSKIQPIFITRGFFCQLSPPSLLLSCSVSRHLSHRWTDGQTIS